MAHGRGLAVLGALVAVLTAALAAGMGLRSLRQDALQAVSRSSRIVVLNTGRAATRVQVTYTGYEGACAGQVVDHKRGPRDLKPAEITIFDQGDMTDSGLPEGCRAAATIRSEAGPVAAVVVDAAEKDEMAAAYLPGPMADGATRVGVPRWQKQEGDGRTISRIHVMNLGDKVSTAQIEFLDASGKPITDCGRDCTKTIGAREAVTWDLGTIEALPAGKGGGSALVTADQPLAVVVNDMSLAGTMDAMLFRGRGAVVGTGRPGRRLLPLALKGARSRTVAVGEVDGISGGGNDALSGIAGAGTTELAIQNLDAANAATIVADFYKQGGGSPAAITKANVGSGAAVTIHLKDETTLSNGFYAAEISSDRAVFATAFNAWATGGGAAAYDDTSAATDVLLPLVLKQAAGHTSLITIQNPDTAAPVSLGLSLFASGSSTPLISTNFVVGPGTSSTIDVSKSAAFATVPAGFMGWVRISAQTPVSVMSFVDIETSERAVYAFEGVTPEMLGDVLFAPVVHARWTGDQPPPTATPTATHTPTDTVTPTNTDVPTVTATRPPRETDTPTASPTRPSGDTATPTQDSGSATATEGPSPTDVPRATLTPIPLESATPTELPTRRPPLVAGRGWFRPCGEANAAAETRMTLGSVDPDGGLWLRARWRSGEERVLRCDPTARTSRLFNDLKEAVGREQANIRRNGTLRDFWAVDGRGFLWTDKQFFDGQRWVEVAKDDIHTGGGARYGRLVLLDKDEKAWMPLESESECQRPLGCRITGARGFGVDGQFGPEVSFEPVPAAGAFGIPDVIFVTKARAFRSILGAGGAGGRSTASAGSSRGNPAARSGDSPAQAGTESGWMVTPGGLIVPPEVKPVAYPFLDAPPPPSPGSSPRLRNAGYATTAAVQPDGRLDVFTWVELQFPRGVEYRIYRNTWNGSAWGTPEDLTQSPLFRGSVKNERITAADYAPDGTLWVGTASGKLGGVKFGLWGHTFPPTASPIGGRPIQSLAVGPGGTVYVTLGELLRDDGSVLPAEVLGFTDEGGFKPVQIHLPIARKALN